jgi:hypothetical protein
MHQSSELLNTIFPLKFAYVPGNIFDISVGQPFDWRHISELPVMRPNPVLGRQKERRI